MTLQGLEVAIKDLFREVYCKEYVGKLKLEELLTTEGTHRGYKLTLGMNNVDKPIIISLKVILNHTLNSLNKNLEIDD